MTHVYGYPDLGEMLATTTDEWFFGVRKCFAIGYQDSVTNQVGFEHRYHYLLVACPDRNNDIHYWRSLLTVQVLVNDEPMTEGDNKKGAWAAEGFVALKRYLDLSKVPFQVAMVGLPKDRSLLTAERPKWLAFDKERGFYLDPQWDEDPVQEVQE